MIENPLIIDLFASNGSTWFNKSYFINDCLKNDIRKGVYRVGKPPYYQDIIINPDTTLDVLNEEVFTDLSSEVVYIDPPHLMNITSGIMFQKYTSLSSVEQLENLALNCSKISDNLLIIKWNDKSIKIDQFLSYFEKYFITTIKWDAVSYLIVMIKKPKEKNDESI